MTLQSDLQASLNGRAEPESVSSLLDKTTTVNKCCVSFKLSSPGSACSCRSASAEGVLDAVADASEKNQKFVPDIADRHNDNLPVNSDSQRPESRDVKPWELLSGEAGQIKPSCSQSDTGFSLLACHSISDENIIAAIACCDTDQPRDDPLCHNNGLTACLAVATPENVNKQCESDLQVSEKSDIQERSSLIAGGMNASSKLQNSSSQNAADARSAISTGCDLNFSSMDEEDLFACFTDDDHVASDFDSSDTDLCKKDISATACCGIESDDIANENVPYGESSLIGSESQSLCHALSSVGIAMADSANSGITDFVLPDSQYSEMIRLKVSDEAMQKSVVKRTACHNGSIGSLSLSHSPQLSQSTSHQLPRYQLRQKQRLAYL